MNALELADYLQNKAEVELQPRLQEAATMLRQQQAEIAELKVMLGHYEDVYEGVVTHPVKEQDESFDRTASHMAGEYVSWTSCVACGQRVTGDSIHTCSPQLKQLTDEEILEYADAFGIDMGTTYEFGHGRFIAVVRAILKNAESNCNGFCGEYECKENQSNCKRKAQENV